jgi:hypothetical protein
MGGAALCGRAPCGIAETDAQAGADTQDNAQSPEPIAPGFEAPPRSVAGRLQRRPL